MRVMKVMTDPGSARGFALALPGYAALTLLLRTQGIPARIVKGYRRPEWQKTRERNEALDCRVYARAAAAVPP